jgi:hypothetical protein
MTMITMRLLYQNNLNQLDDIDMIYDEKFEIFSIEIYFFLKYLETSVLDQTKRWLTIGYFHHITDLNRDAKTTK